MNCAMLRDAIPDLLESEVEPSVREAATRHMGRCEDCRRAFAEYRATVELIRDADFREDAPRPGPMDALVFHALDAARAGRKPRPRWITKARWLLGLERTRR